MGPGQQHHSWPPRSLPAKLSKTIFSKSRSDLVTAASTSSPAIILPFHLKVTTNLTRKWVGDTQLKGTHYWPGPPSVLQPLWPAQILDPSGHKAWHTSSAHSPCPTLSILLLSPFKFRLEGNSWVMTWPALDFEKQESKAECSASCHCNACWPSLSLVTANRVHF